MRPPCGKLRRARGRPSGTPPPPTTTRTKKIFFFSTNIFFSYERHRLSCICKNLHHTEKLQLSAQKKSLLRSPRATPRGSAVGRRAAEHVAQRGRMHYFLAAKGTKIILTLCEWAGEQRKQTKIFFPKPKKKIVSALDLGFAVGRRTGARKTKGSHALFFVDQRLFVKRKNKTQTYFARKETCPGNKRLVWCG